MQSCRRWVIIFGSGFLPSSVYFSLHPEGKAITHETKQHRLQKPSGLRETGGKKSKAKGRPRAQKESCLYWREPTPMHSSAKNRGLPGESRDERLTHIGGGGSWARAATNTHRSPPTPPPPKKKILHKSTNNYTVVWIRMYLVPPSPPSVCLIVLSVRMVFELWSTAGILCNTRRLVKRNWLIYWVSGPEVGGILEAPWRSHHGIIQRGQRAHSRNNRGEISGSWVQCLFVFFFSVSALLALWNVPYLGSLSFSSITLWFSLRNVQG